MGRESKEIKVKMVYERKQKPIVLENYTDIPSPTNSLSSLSDVKTALIFTKIFFCHQTFAIWMKHLALLNMLWTLLFNTNFLPKCLTLNSGKQQKSYLGPQDLQLTVKNSDGILLEIMWEGHKIWKSLQILLVITQRLSISESFPL